MQSWQLVSMEGPLFRITYANLPLQTKQPRPRGHGAGEQQCATKWPEVRGSRAHTAIVSSAPAPAFAAAPGTAKGEETDCRKVWPPCPQDARL